MSGVYGWTGCRQVDDPLSLLARMGADGASGDGCWAQQHGETAALGIRCWGKTGYFVADDAIWIALNGYPVWRDETLATLARERGHAAAALEAWRRSRSAMLHVLGGAFQLAVFDHNTDTTMLAIDRHGIHSCAYADLGPNGLVFGATSAAVAAHPAVDRTISPQGMFDYFYFYAIPAPRSIYAAQRKLCIGEALIRENGRLRTWRYWRPPYLTGQHPDETELFEELDETLEAATARALEGEDANRTAAFLSGGLDSTTVAVMWSRVAARPPRCVSVGFEDKRYDESPYARIAAEECGADHTIVTLTPEQAVAAIPRLAKAYDEPFGNSSAVPALVCSETARALGVDVMLAGDGGDEIFAGNQRYAIQMRLELLDKRIPSSLRGPLLAGLSLGGPLAESVQVLRRGRNLLRYLEAPLPDRMLIYSRIHRTPLDELLTRDFLAMIDTDEPLVLMREAYARSASGDPLQGMMALDAQLTLADNDLRKVIRTCAMAKLRVRFPMLDDEVVAFAARVPPAMLLRGLKLRDFYRRGAARFLPAATIEKPKHGFGMPFGQWTVTHPPLKALASDAIAAFRSRRCLNDTLLDSILNDLRSNVVGPYAGLVWGIMMLESWLNWHVDR